MASLIAGAAGGMLVASVFVCASTLMLFAIVRDPPPWAVPVLAKVHAPTLAMSVVLLAYPTWAVIGFAMGALYEISSQQSPRSGMGSPNLAFTLSVVVGAVMLSAPLVIVLRRLAAGVLAIALAFMGAFGWFLPHFAS